MAANGDIYSPMRGDCHSAGKRGNAMTANTCAQCAYDGIHTTFESRAQLGAHAEQHPVNVQEVQAA